MKKLRYHFDLRKEALQCPVYAWHCQFSRKSLASSIMYEIPNWAMRLFYTVHIIKYNLNPF